MWGSGELLVAWFLVLAADGTTEHVYRPSNMPASMWEWRELHPPRTLPLPCGMAGRYLPDRAGSQASGSSMSCWSGWASSWAAGWSTCTTRPIQSSAVGTSARW
uniref:Predicted gene 20532 n=1 Tax=Mus musculus TaxID=10090 RepID=G3UXR8_MOUSE